MSCAGVLFKIDHISPDCITDGCSVAWRIRNIGSVAGTYRTVHYFDDNPGADKTGFRLIPGGVINTGSGYGDGELKRVRVDVFCEDTLHDTKTVYLEGGVWIELPPDPDPPDPDPDPCDGVVCDPTCYGYDRHDTYCSEGVCIKGAIIEENASICGYTPPDPDGRRRPPCYAPDGLGYGDINGDGFVTQEDSDMLIQYLFGNITLTEAQKIRANVDCQSHILDMNDASTIAKYAAGGQDFSVCRDIPPPDPCDGVVCDPTCYGYDRHDTYCSEGVCIKGAIIEENASICGYTPPDPDPDPDPDDKMNIVFMLIIAFVIYVMVVSK